MALFMNQENERSDLQKRIAAELREKTIKNSLGSGDGVKNKDVDFEEDSRYLEGTKETTGLAFVWLLLGVAIIIAVTFFIMFIK